MNKIIFTVLFGGASALAGVVSGYFIFKKKTEAELQKKYEEEVNKEISRLRKYNEDRYSETKKNIEKKENDINKEKVEYSKIPVKNYLDKFIEESQEFTDLEMNPYRRAVLTAKYNDCLKKGLSNKDISESLREIVDEWEEDPDAPEGYDPITEVESDIQLQQDEFENDPPRVIPLSEYENLPPYFENVTYTYFDEDDVLLDEGDMVIDDPEFHVGDALTYFGDKAASLSRGDDNAVYVANGRMGHAIEIVRVHSSYVKYMGME